MSDISYGVQWILPRQIRIIIAITDAIITGLGKRTERGQRKKKERGERKTRGNGKQRNETKCGTLACWTCNMLSPEFLSSCPIVNGEEKFRQHTADTMPLRGIFFKHVNRVYIFVKSNRICIFPQWLRANFEGSY